MKTLLNARQGKHLLIYFAGWGTPPAAVEHLNLPADYDLLICYDYQTFEFDFDFSPYEEIRLVAWSMGVWAAERVLKGVPLVSATAVNGTGLPCHDELGIPVAIFEGTLNGLSPITRTKFERRMCAKADFVAYSALTPRDFDEISAELTALWTALQQDLRTDLITWTKAIIAEQDKIFPAAHQQAYWQSRCAVQLVPGEHYLFPQFSHWNQLWD